MTLTATTPIAPVIWRSIPVELRHERRFAIWRAEPDGTGRITKVPYIAGSPRRRASATKAGTWGTLAQARAALDHGEGDGLLVALGDGLCGVDLDGVRNAATGAIEREALAEIAALDSYSEVSPSGEGIHILLRGGVALPDGRTGAKHGHVEAYTARRFLALTGWQVPESRSSIVARHAALAAFYRRVFPAQAVPTRRDTGGRPYGSVGLVTPDDVELIARACSARDGGKFARLWAGDTTGYPSASEAVAALCCKLAHWTRGDGERMDRLFRLSGLMTPKWDARRGETTWGDREIAHALQVTSTER